MMLKLVPCGVTTMKSELEMGHTKHSLLKVTNAMTAIHNRAIHCIVDQMVELAIRGL